MHRKNYVSPKGSPLPGPHLGLQPPSKLSNIGRAVADMIPLSKLQLNSLKMKMTKMPDRMRSIPIQKNVVVANDREAVVKRGDTNEAEVPNEARAAGTSFQTRENRLFQVGLDIHEDESMSRSVSTLNSPDFEISVQGSRDSLVLLKSCGILWISAKRVITALHRCGVGQHSVSLTAANAQAVDYKASAVGGVLFRPEGIVTKKKELFNTPMSKSLDIDETSERVKLINDHSVKLPDNHPEKNNKQKAAADVSSNTSSVMPPSEDLIDFNTVHPGDVSKSNNDHQGVDEDPVAEVEHNPLHITEDIPLGETPAVGSAVGQRPVRRPTIMLDDKEVVLSHPPPLEQRISLLKLSYSEGALVNSVQSSESSNFDPDDLDNLDPDAGDGQGSAFSKLRVKMANLSIPTMQQPVAQQKQLQHTVRNNALKSRLRFKECKTKILLL